MFDERAGMLPKRGRSGRQAAVRSLKTSRRLCLAHEPLEDRHLLAVAAPIFSEMVDPSLAGTHELTFPVANSASGPSNLFATGEIERSISSPDVYSLIWHEQQVDARAGEWIVKFSDGPVAPLAVPSERLAAAVPGIKVTQELGSPNLLLVRTNVGTTFAELTQILSTVPGFQYAEPNILLSSMATIPNDPSLGNQWSMHNTGQSGGKPDADIDAPEAWDLHTGSGNVVVAVFDTGVDYNHPDLAANIWSNPGEIADNGIDDDGNGYIDDIRGWDYVANDNDPMDENYHGTAVAGIIGAVGNNGIGVAGINWNTQILSIRILGGASGAAQDANVAGALLGVHYINELKRDYGINIVAANHSWGTGYSTALRDAIAESGALGILHIAAAGNSNHNNDRTPIFPASYDLDNVISVAATTPADLKSNYSSFGPTTVHLGAPADGTYTTGLGGSYRSFSGTSAATPHVVGAAALLFDAFPDATYQEVRQAIFDGVDPIPTLAGRTITGGRLNLFNAFQQMAFRVNASSPGAGEVVTAPPLDFAFTFSQPIDLGSIQASDLLVNATPADWITFGSETVSFHYDVSPVTSEGLQSMHLSAGVVTRLFDLAPLREFDASFRYDALPLEVVATSPTPGSIVEAPLASLIVDFNESFDPASIDAGDLILSQGSVASYTIIDEDSVEFHLTGVFADGVVVVQIPAGAVTDGFGNPVVAHSTQIDIDVNNTLLKPFVQLEPFGSLITASLGNSGLVSHAYDYDGWEFSAVAGEIVSVVITPLDPDLQLLASIEPLTTPAWSTAPGAPLVLPPTHITFDSTFRVVVTGDTRGTYRIDIYRHASIEGSDSSVAAPLDISDSFVELGPGGRWAVVGHSRLPRIVIEPDDYLGGIRLNEAVPGAHLSTSNNPASDVSVALATGFGAATGTQVFASALYGAGGFSNTNRLDIQLDTPARSVSVRVGSNDSSDQSYLSAYRPNGSFVQQSASRSLGLGRWQTLTIDRPTPDIGRIQVGNYFSGDPSPVDRVEFVYDEIDEYTLDLSSELGHTIDIALKGLDGVDFSAARLELIAPNGSTIATAVDSLSELANVDLAISDFLVADVGVYRLRLTSSQEGDYSLIVTKRLLFDTELNDLPDDSLRSLGAVSGAFGYLDALPVLGTLDFQIDSSTSTVVLSGNAFFIVSFPLVEQALGTLATQFTGTVRATMADGFIRFDNGSQIEAVDHVGFFQPGFGDADFAGQFDLEDAGFGLAYATMRDVVLDLFGDPLLVNPDGSFGLDGVSMILSGALAAVISEVGSASISGALLLDNVADVPGTIVRDGGFAHLTVPINMQVAIPVPESLVALIVNLQLSGEIHATARVPLPVDIYEITLAAGESVSLMTATPLGGSIDTLANTLDPRIEIRSEDGSLLAADDNSYDGRHAWLGFVAPTAGVYRVEVSAVSGRGAYLLVADGHAGSAPLPFDVVSINPPDGSRLNAPISDITVDFNSIIDLDTLDASDLTADGTPATSIEVIDANTLRFYFAAPLSEGYHQIRLNADSLRSSENVSLAEFVSELWIDTTGPQVVGSSLENGAVLSTEPFSVTVQFSEEILGENLGTFDFFAVDSLSGQFYTPFEIDYVPDPSILTLYFAGLPEGDYQLVLVSGDFALEDILGNDLDGEISIVGLPSGDGVPGGDYVVNVTVDVGTIGVPTPLVPIGPAASLIHHAAAGATIQVAGDLDAFTLSVDGGQTISVLVTSEGTLQPTIELISPIGNSLGSATALAAGLDALLQARPADESGVYRLVVGGHGGSTGAFTIQVFLNAALEEETHGLGSNDTLATAQDLDNAFVTLTGSAERAAVVGISGLPVFRSSLTQQDNVFSPNVLTYSFSGVPLAPGVGWLRLAALADLGVSSEYLAISAEGLWLGNVFVNDGGELTPSATSIPLSAALLDALAADGVIEFTVTPSFEVNNLGPSSLTLALEYGTTPDLYRFTLDPGQVSTLVLKNGGADATLELLDEFGETIAEGLAGDSNVDLAIRDFVSASGGSFFVRTSASSGVEYSLLVLRDAAFEAEGNNSPATAQDITPSRTALGSIFGMGIAPISMESEPNDDRLSGASLTDLDLANDLRGSFESIGGSNYRAAVSGTIAGGNDSDWDFFRVRAVPGDTYTISLVGHSLPDTYLWLFDRDGVLLAVDDDGGVGLNSLILFSSFSYEGDYYIAADSYGGNVGTYELVVTWTTSHSVNLDEADFYSVTLQAGETVSIDTRTPGDGPGEFVNLLDPAIEVFGSDGLLLAANDNGAIDGRNSHLTFTASDAGTYFVRVSKSADDAPGGEYVLSISTFPEARLSGPHVVLVDEEYSFALSGLSLDLAQQSGQFTYDLDWDGDGQIDESIVDSDITSVSHTFTKPGVFQVGLAVYDAEGNASGTGQLLVAVVALTVAPDQEQPGVSNLVWIGSEGDDVVAFQELSGGIVRTVISQVQGVTLATNFEIELPGITGGIIARGRAGNDFIDADQLALLAATLDGGQGHDTLRGGAADDLLVGDTNEIDGDGLEGNDVIDGGAGNDRIFADGHDGGEGGADTVVGGTGNDYIYGDATADGLEGGNDMLLGEDGNDFLFGGRGNDLLLGDAGDDRSDGGEGNDTLLGGVGNDTLNGNQGNDVLVGGADNDHLSGGVGSDQYVFEGTALGLESISEAPSSDFDYLVFLGFQHAISIDIGLTTEQDVAHGQLFLTLDSALGIEGVIGTSYDDHVVGNALDNLLFGSDGADELHGGDGRDVLIGGAGLDTLFGDAGEDLLLTDILDTGPEDPRYFVSQVMAEWTTSSSYADRRAHLSGTPGGANHKTYLSPGMRVFDDQAVDHVTGGDSDLDWYIYSLLDDVLSDHEVDEEATDTAGFVLP